MRDERGTILRSAEPKEPSVISPARYIPESSTPVVKEPEPVRDSITTVLRQPVKNESPATIFSNSEITINNNEITPNSSMTAFGKTIVGKILKGAAIAGGSVLALTTGVGAIAGVAKGVGALAGIAAAKKTTAGAVSKVAQSAVNLVTGTSKAERDQVKEVKAEAKAAADKLEQMNRLIKAGASTAQARAMAGVPEEQLTSYEGEPITKSGFGDFFAANKQMIMIVGGLLAAFLFLPKILKKR